MNNPQLQSNQSNTRLPPNGSWKGFLDSRDKNSLDAEDGDDPIKVMVMRHDYVYLMRFFLNVCYHICNICALSNLSIYLSIYLFIYT